MSEEQTETGVPRWVKLAGVIAAIVVLVVIVAMLVGGGGHTPRRHGPPDAPTSAPAAHVPPTGVHG